MLSISDFHFERDLGDGRKVCGRCAQIGDESKIQALYNKIYNNKYPLSIVNDRQQLTAALTGKEFLWVLVLNGDEAVGSVVYQIDHQQRIGKAFAAVVDPAYQGHRLTEMAMGLVEKQILSAEGSCDLIYATTRTVSLAPQKLTEKLGYAKLGIFPNVHRVMKYETHALTAHYGPGTLNKRRTRPQILPELESLYTITKEELGLDEAEIVDADVATCRDFIVLDVIREEKYVRDRFIEGVAANHIANRFYSFQNPNVLLKAPDGSFEIFLFLEHADGHACIIGGRSGDTDYNIILNSVVASCREMGVRYIEMLIGAYRPLSQRIALSAKFIPSAFFPALRLIKAEDNHSFFSDGERSDYFIFSRSFEGLDFASLRIAGSNRKYLQYYFQMWQKMFIGDVLEE